MKINWIIDQCLFDEYETKLVDAIIKNGGVVHFYNPLNRLSFIEFVKQFTNNKEIYIFHGSLQHGRQLYHIPIYPGVFMNIQNYECYKYYGYYGNYLLNSTYLMMGLNDVIRNKCNIQKISPNYGFGQRGNETKVFIRPSDGHKTFPGQIISLDKIENEIDMILKTYGGVDIDTLVLLSPIQNITEEYRFIVVDGEVISGALYMDENNRKDLKPYYDKPVYDGKEYEFAIKMSKIYQPDKTFTMDICKTQSGSLKLLEINSFNCASMYGNDYEKVVNAVNELAIRDYNDLFPFE